MNSGEHSRPGGGQVDVGQSGQNSALIELRRRLIDGLVRAGLTKTQLAARARVGRTTVQQAFRAGGPAPSAQTVALLARVLKLPVEELLDLQRSAGNSDLEAISGGGLGKLIADWEPHSLEVHPAGPASPEPGSVSPEQRTLPGYVRRAHDHVLAQAVREAGEGRSRMLVLVGSSSTGKTRACWEAIQPLAQKGWRLWHPFDPTRAEAALNDLHRVPAHTVVWLNEAQHYLGNPRVGQQIAAAIHALLIEPEHEPILILGTLWPDYVAQFTASDGASEAYSRVRELLAGRTLTVPDAFDAAALRIATSLAEAGDSMLADALTRAGADGRVTQDLAGAPELVHRYDRGTPAARAVLEAAMDARRLGVGLRLPKTFLVDAATDYLSDPELDQLPENWVEQTFQELAQTVHGKQAPVRRTTTRPQRRPPSTSTQVSARTSTSTTAVAYRLADYLEQLGRDQRRQLCPPASFWDAAHAYLTQADDLTRLAREAERRHRLEWAFYLYRRSAALGNRGALLEMVRMREEAGDRKGAETLARKGAEGGWTTPLVRLGKIRVHADDREGARPLFEQAAEAGDTDGVHWLARLEFHAGHKAKAKELYQQAAEAGDTKAMTTLAYLYRDEERFDEALDLYTKAADAGDTYAMNVLAGMLEDAGQLDEAEDLYWSAVNAGSYTTLGDLARLRAEAGEWDAAKVLARRQVQAGSIGAMVELAIERDQLGDESGAEELIWESTAAGNVNGFGLLAEAREEAGDREAAEGLVRRAAEAGHPKALFDLAEWRWENDDPAGAAPLYEEAGDLGYQAAVGCLALLREESGDETSAEALYRQDVDTAGGTASMVLLAVMREQAGDTAAAEALLKRALDATTHQITAKDWARSKWPYGLDPDGAPTPPWQPDVLGG